MQHRKVNFQNAEGLSLSARLDFPIDNRPCAYVLFAHCFTGSKNFKAVDAISEGLTKEGMAVFRFDFTGLGQSEGDFADTNFSSNLSDLEAAYAYLEEHFEAPQILVGHSLGGAAALHVATRLPKVKAVATIGSPSTPVHVGHLLEHGLDDLMKTGQAQVNIGGRPFQIKKQFLEDLEKNDNVEVIRDLNRALLILHSPQDMIVKIDNAAEIYRHARHPKSFITLDGADHLLTQPRDAEYAGRMIAEWAGRYIQKPEAELAPEGEVWVQLDDDAGYTTQIMAGKHHLIADEPASVGGRDAGPSPYGFLLSALGACTAMTLRMYANHKKWDLQDVEVRLTHDKVHLEDGRASEESTGKIDLIQRKIRLVGNLDSQQRQRLIEIANRCPVHKTIEGKPKIETEELS